MYCSWIQCRVWDHFESNPMLVFIKYDHLRTSSFCFVTVVVPYHGIGFRDWCSDLGHRNWGYYPLPFNRPNSRAESWNFSQVPILHLFLSLFDMLFMTGGGFRNWMFPLWFALLGGSLVFLDVGPSILFIVSPPPPFFGCFDLFMIGMVSSILHPCWQVLGFQHELQWLGVRGRSIREDCAWHNPPYKAHSLYFEVTCTFVYHILISFA